jgi:cytochrome P450
VAARFSDLITYLVAGHDTTGYTLSWILLEVARHPEVYARIKQEIEILGFNYLFGCRSRHDGLHLVLDSARGWRVHPYL